MTNIRFTKDMSRYELVHDKTCIGGVQSVAQIKFANLVLEYLSGDCMLPENEIAIVAKAMTLYLNDTEIVSK